MSIAITNDHCHRHLHNDRGHGGGCTCRACRYDGTLNDVLRFKNAVETIASGAGDEDTRVGGGACPGRSVAPAGTPARTIERLGDEVDDYAFHHGGTIDVYA